MTPDQFTALLRRYHFDAHLPNADIAALAEKLRGELAIATLRLVGVTTETYRVPADPPHTVGGHEIAPWKR